MNVIIIGSGYVGRTTGSYISKLGHIVYYYDKSEKVLDHLRVKGNLVVYDYKEFPRDTDIFIISVPTPTGENGEQDLNAVLDALEKTAFSLKNNTSSHPIILVKSTVLPLTTENTIIPFIEKQTGLKPNQDFGVVYSPEFISEIHHTWTNDPRYRINAEKEMLVIGESSNKLWGDIIIDKLYLSRKKAFRTNYRIAEMIKYVLNTALASRISFWNEIFLISQRLRIDSNIVAQIVGLDPRIGFYGTVHGKAFGGKCLPKDLKAFIRFAEKYHEPILLKAVEHVNEYMARNYGVRE